MCGCKFLNRIISLPYAEQEKVFTGLLILLRENLLKHAPLSGDHQAALTLATVHTNHKPS